MNISKKIKELREERGLFQSDIAESIGMEQANYSRIERKGKKLTIEQLEDIAGALGVSIKEILFSEQGSDLERELEFAEREIELLKREMALLNQSSNNS